MVWTANLAYVVGLITTDGSLSKDGRHIDFTSKDYDQIKTFAKILKLKNKIGSKYRGEDHSSYCHRIQFGNVTFYRWLLKIGLKPNKSKTLGSLKVPSCYFADFLRGHLDGDGYVSSFFGSRWKKSYRLHTTFISASLLHINWLRDSIRKDYNIVGKINSHNNAFYLRFAKGKSIQLLKYLYYKKGLPSLERKRSKITQALGIIHKQAGMLKLVYRHA